MLRYFDHVFPLAGAQRLTTSRTCWPGSTTCWPVAREGRSRSATGGSSTSTPWSRSGSSSPMSSTPPTRSCSTCTPPASSTASGSTTPTGSPTRGLPRRLRDATGGAWVVVEKILARGRATPSAGPRAGTHRLRRDRASSRRRWLPDTGAELDQLWRDLSPATGRSHWTVELERQARGRPRPAPPGGRAPHPPDADCQSQQAAAVGDVTDHSARSGEALGELLAHVDVYRAYVRLGRHRPTRHRCDRVGAMVRRAAAEPARPGRDPGRGCSDLLLDIDSVDPAGSDLVMRFQQVCGPVMAKGVEDTTFYRFNRFVALNEVGGDPVALDIRRSGACTPGREHQQRRSPARDDDAVDARHQAQRRRPGPAAGRRPQTSRRGRSCGRPCSARRPTDVVDPPTAYLVFQTARRRLADRRRTA